MLLTEALDAFGQNRVALDWWLMEADKRAARRALQLVTLAVGEIGAGRGPRPS